MQKFGFSIDEIKNLSKDIVKSKINAIKEKINFFNDYIYLLQILILEENMEKLNLKETFKKEYEKYKQNPPHVNSNAEYALSSMTEFFAESYSLLNIGNCKSAYVIANYFPETFARAKEIMEQNRAFREQ